MIRADVKRCIGVAWMVLCAVAIHAQGTKNALRVHLHDGTVEQQAIAQIDSITFVGDMTVNMQDERRLHYTFEDVDSITFAEVLESDFYEAVDLGLTVKWAAFNIGATAPEESGDFFAWGETIPKTDYSEETYAFNNDGQYEIIGTNICATKYDAARQIWGGEWRLPTRSEVADLTNKCTWTAETLSGIAGYRVTGQNGNSIFLPAAGYQDATENKEVGTGGFYWSGNVNRSLTSTAYNLNFQGYTDSWAANRCYGFTIRAVK